MKRCWHTLILILVCAVTVCSAGCLKESRIAVTDMVVAPESVTAGQAVLNVSTSIENIFGFGADRARVLLQAFDTDTGLLVYESTRDVGVIGRGETVIVPCEMLLPRTGSYRIVAKVFEGRRQKAEGEITVSSLETLPTDSARTGVGVTGMDFIVREVTQGQAVIEADVYLTSLGAEPNPPLAVEVKAREADARLVADRQWTTVEEIQPGATVMRSVTLSIPDQYNYDVEVTLWRGDVIVERGLGHIFLAPGRTVDEGEDFVTKKIETGRFISSHPTATPPAAGPVRAATPGFEALIAITALVCLCVCRRWRYRG